MITPTKVKELREKTGAGFMDCKKALEETKGDFEQAVDTLRKKGIINAAKRKGKDATEGSIFSYIHQGGKIGVLLELKCETDFVARTTEFINLQKEISLHIAAMAPKYLKPEDVPADVLEREKEIFRAQGKQSGKPDNVIEKILEGRVNKFYSEVCLLEQLFVKDDKKKIQELVDEIAGKLGENVHVSRFCRFELGENK
jgi:elongation factor Ts